MIQFVDLHELLNRMAMSKKAALKTKKPKKLKLTPEEAAAEISQRAIIAAAEHGRRVIIGIAGGPGSGKSTLAADVIGKLNDTIDGSAARVPMDGFHMKQAKLEAEELVAHKGAPQTFEAKEFVTLLTKLKNAKMPVPVPGYSRRTEDVVPDAFTIAGNVPILVAEGNYLLLDREPWNKIIDILDLAVYIAVPPDIVRERLLKRHDEHGLFTKERNKEHVEKVDMVNYKAVADSGHRADLWIDIDTKS